jgi:flagellar biosynthesis/type III secretory pathway M-ring protein FliF/YscJ
VFLLLYFMFIRPVQKSFFSATLEPAGGAQPSLKAGGGQGPMTVKQLEAKLKAGEAITIADDFANSPERELLALPTPTRMDLIRKRVVEHAKEDPESVARLVRVWLNDEKNR